MKKLRCSFQDYTEEDRPLTRKEVFFSCYKERFSLLLKLGLICMLLVVPFVIVSFLKESYLSGALEGIEDQAERSTIYFGAELVFGAAKILCYLIFALFFSGVTQILRQTLWDEPLFFGDDFKNGLKSNSIKFGVTALILAVMNYLLNLYSANILKYILNGIFVSIILPVAVWFALQGIYYKAKVGVAIKNAEIIYLKTIPVSLLLLICTVVPFWLLENFVAHLVIRYVVLLALALFYIVPLTMCWMLYGCHIFDKLVNKDEHPEIYRKGMQREQDDADIDEIKEDESENDETENDVQTDNIEESDT